ncbi:unnamed protein product [Pelagomonas calceolata]|uniref:Uncharacterized protein n=1 Tax=Pelagomonas calceolata TaxID=35677 RepID=A0A8J2SFP8_9STRA|nr:unnamed protein product [Pelagomonas calceolata]
MRALLLLVSVQALAPNRRTFLVATAGGAASASASTDGAVREISLGEAVKAIITDGNPDWVRAVVQAGFIYRGVAEASPTLRRDPYDLYSPATYNSARAATYFRSLDAALDKIKAPGPRARTAHLAVANAEAAAQWGTAASIWPLGSISYAWGPTAFWPTKDRAITVAESLRVDEGLADCIRDGREVLYACDASIAVPRSLEPSLRAGLGLL